MDSSVSLEDQIWFLRVCHHFSFSLYQCSLRTGVYRELSMYGTVANIPVCPFCFVIFLTLFFVERRAFSFACSKRACRHNCGNHLQIRGLDLKTSVSVLNIAVSNFGKLVRTIEEGKYFTHNLMYITSNSCEIGTGSFPGVKCGRGVLLTTHPF